MKFSRKMAALSAAITATLVAAGCSTATNEDTASTESPTTAQSPTKSLLLPFSVSPDTYAPQSLLEIQPDSAPKAEYQPLWTIGGDFRNIVSFPLNENEVFGSLSTTPNNVSSYIPVVYNQSLQHQAIAVESPDATYYEPQDGTSASDQEIVWRSGSVNASLNIDQWKISYFNKEKNFSTDIAEATKLFQQNDIPRLTAEHLPTASQDFIYMESSVPADGSWKSGTLQFTKPTRADENSTSQIITDTSAVVATLKYVLLVDETQTKIELFDEQSSKRTAVFSIDPASGWKIANIWGSDKYASALITTTDGSEPGFLCVWNMDQQPGTARWIKLTSPLAIASINDTWLTWGGGWSNSDSGMFALDLTDDQSSVTFLGDAPGYSRPQLSPHGDTVLIPRVNPENIAEFTIAQLQHNKK